MADNMNCFEIDNLSFAYGDKKVIDDFSVQIKKGTHKAEYDDKMAGHFAVIKHNAHSFSQY